jgi:mutator protein MutT
MIHVVAGAVTAADGRVLIAQRPPGKPLAGGWEFPGGKLEPGEARAAGLARELCEELGIVIRDPRPLMRVRHTYPHGEVLIDLWVVSRYQGEPRGVDGQALRWLMQDELAGAPLLPADRPMVRALRLPERLTEASSPHYSIEAPAAASPLPASPASPAPTVLRGLSCTGAEAAVRAAAEADFLVMQQPLSADALQRLCEQVPVPVYARGLGLEAAWAQGASGIAVLGP